MPRWFVFLSIFCSLFLRVKIAEFLYRLHIFSVLCLSERYAFPAFSAKAFSMRRAT